jgi:hypothetical protein
MSLLTHEWMSFLVRCNPVVHYSIQRGNC